MKKLMQRLLLVGAIFGLLGCIGEAAAAQSLGPYTVVRTLPLPSGGIGDLEFAGGYLYSVDDYNGNIHRLDPMTGQVLASWSVPDFSLHNSYPDHMPTGLAWDGTNMWMATRGPNYLRKLTLSVPPGVSVDAIYTMPSSPQDLAYCNGLLMYPEYLGPIRKVNPATGAAVGSIPSPNSFIYSLTFDGHNLVADAGLQSDDRLWVVSPDDGSIIDIWHTGIGGMTGLAYDSDSRSLYMGYPCGVAVAQIIPEPRPLTFLIGVGVGLSLRNRARRLGTGYRSWLKSSVAGCCAWRSSVSK